MARYSRFALLFLAAGIFSAVLMMRGVKAQAPAKPAGSGPRMTEDVFKNIQVLKGVPADQLIPTMQFITASLGVECDFCHVQGAFEKDDKKPKETARKMMQMMFAINKDNFGGHREVTCYSCHHGTTDPVSIPAIAEAEPRPMMPPPAPGEAAAKPNLPSVDDVLNKYVQAVGGEDAIRKITSRDAKGKTTVFGGRQVPVEVLQKAPDKRAAVMKMGASDVVTAYDGHVGWMGAPRRPPRNVSGGELDSLKLDADMAFPADAKQVLSDLKVQALEPIDSKPALVVTGRMSDELRVKLYFDQDSGLLVRQVRYLETPLGRLPTEFDYTDYRDSGGVKVPFQWTIARPGSRFTMQIESAETNVPIDDSKFAEPPAPPEEKKPAGK